MSFFFFFFVSSFDKSCGVSLDRSSGDIKIVVILFQPCGFSMCLIRMSEECVKNCEGSEVLPYLEIYKLAFHTFMDASRN